MTWFYSHVVLLYTSRRGKIERHLIHYYEDIEDGYRDDGRNLEVKPELYRVYDQLSVRTMNEVSH